MNKILVLALILAFVSFLLYGASAFSQKNSWLFVGTYTNGGSTGIYVYKYHKNNIAPVPIDSTTLSDPSYLAISTNKKYLYSVSETSGSLPGMLHSFAFNNKTGKLNSINAVPSGGGDPCHVAVNSNGNWVAVANYTGGSFSIFKVNDNGSLQLPAQTIQHAGSSVVTSRQEKPHVHSVTFSPNEEYLIVADLGTDEVVAYPFDPKKVQPLDANNKIIIKTAAGSGPRHIAFHPSKPYLYVLEELSGIVGVYNFTNDNKSLVQRIASDTISPLPDRGSADIHFSNDGRFLYTSNRGSANNLSIFLVNAATGKLTYVASQPSLGQKPRNFMITPNDKYLLVANMGSNNIIIFKRNRKNGLLSATKHSINISSPVCLRLIKN